VTDTGTGKSTLLPKLLMERGGKVVSSQPRRTATINLAVRVSSLRDEPLGTNVGYLVRGERQGDVDTCNLMYMTSYTLFLYIISHPDDLGYTHFIIDEFHERQPDVEVMLALLKLARLKTKSSFKIILMSASAEVHEWRPYFEGLKVGVYSTCKPRYPVYEYYAEEVCRLIGAYHEPTAVTPVVSSLSLKNRLFLIKQLLKFLATRGDASHSILVFLPGRTIVEQMATYIEKTHGTQLEAVQWYRDVELDRIAAAFKRTSATRKKVYLATDIAEVSITLPDVVFVIDSGTTKKPRIDEKVRNTVVFPPLELLMTSKSSASQRRGRVGRVQQGFYMSLIEEPHLAMLVDMDPQIANSRIDELSLHILQIAANPLAVFNLCRTNTKMVSIQLSTNILVDNGCALPMSHQQALEEAVEHPDSAPWRSIVMAHPANESLNGASFVTTVKGKITQRLPLSVSASLVVCAGVTFSMESIAILAAAIVATGTPFYAFQGDLNPEEKMIALKKTADDMKSVSAGVNNDVVASLIMALEYKEMTSQGLAEEDEEQWCLAHSASRIRLQNIVKLEAQIKEQLGAIVSYVDEADPVALLKQVKDKAKTVSWMIASAFFDRAIFVEYDPNEAQRRRKVGSSLFLGFDALCDNQVASCVEWQKGSIILPTILQVRYNKLFGAFAIRLASEEFNMLLVLLSYCVYFSPNLIEENGGKYMVMAIELHQRKLVFKVDAKIAQQALQFREGSSVRMRLERKMMIDTVSINDAEGLKEAAAAAGLPGVMPHALGDKLTALLMTIMTEAFKLQGTACRPFFPATPKDAFVPTKVSIILSASSSMQDFVPPPPPPPAPVVEKEEVTNAVIEDDE
jgi:HrpA-like RNA helicase